VVSQSVYLGVKPHLRPKTRFFVTVGQLQVCLCGVPSLTRGQVCCLQLLMALASAVIFTMVKISSTCHLYLQFLHVGILHSQLSRVWFLVDTYYLQFYM
jgi:hypothetical protein